MAADERTPYWMVARYDTWYAKGLINFTNDLPGAETLLARAKARRHIPNDLAEILVWQAKAKFLQNQLPACRQLLVKALAYDSLNVSAFTLAYSLMGELEANNGNDQAAEAYFKKGADYLGDEFYKEEAFYRYGLFLLNKDRIEEAEKQFQFCQWFTKNHGFWGEYGLALLNAKLGKEPEAVYQLQKALERYFPFKEVIMAESLFKNISNGKQFQGLMEKYFPD